MSLQTAENFTKSSINYHIKSLCHLVYGDFLYDKAYSNTLHYKVESVHCNACPTLTGAIRGTSKEKFYQELGLESLRQWQCYRKLCNYCKILKNQSPPYLSKMFLAKALHTIRTAANLPLLSIKHGFFKNSFIPATINEWNNLGINIWDTECFGILTNAVLSFIRPSASSVYNCHNPKGIKLLAMLHLNLSHLPSHKFKHGFQDSLEPPVHLWSR